MSTLKLSTNQPAPPTALVPADAYVPPTIIIEPLHGWSSIRWGELWDFRDLLYFMVWRDIKTRYRQTALGPIWIIVQPLVSMALYTIVFGVIAKLPSDNLPYTVFTYTALLPWGFFSDTLGTTTHSLLSSKELISKVYFPRLLIPVSRLLSSLVDMAIEIGILFLLLIYYHIRPTWGIVLLPLFLAIGAMVGMGVGFWFSGVIVKYRDFAQISSYLVRAWMYATPVVYSAALIPPQWRTIYYLNPMANVVDGFRWALLGAPPPDWLMMGISTLIFVPIFIIGLYHFKSIERSIVDVA